MAPHRNLPESEWPENQDAVRFIVLSQPDHAGRQTFFALWWMDGRRRGQAFRDNLDEQVRQARRDAAVVEIVERFEWMKEAA